MLFLVLARDANDSGALDRRQQVRAEHLERLDPLVKEGIVKVAGALLNDADQPVGSSLLIEAEDETHLSTLLEADPYTKQRVWKSFEIHRFRRAY